nr:MFS transporter [Pseudomonas sp. dw_358]
MFVMSWAFGQMEPVMPMLALPLFMAGIAGLFLSIPRIGLFRRALHATEDALDTPNEPAAWVGLARIRRFAFLLAGIPAWVAALAVPFGLEPLPQCVLAVISVGLLCLYRIPAKMGTAV